jgi:hypothetical protein
VPDDGRMSGNGREKTSRRWWEMMLSYRENSITRFSSNSCPVSFRGNVCFYNTGAAKTDVTIYRIATSSLE